jgi:hypothetical protein
MERENSIRHRATVRHRAAVRRRTVAGTHKAAVRQKPAGAATVVRYRAMEARAGARRIFVRQRRTFGPANHSNPASDAGRSCRCCMRTPPGRTRSAQAVPRSRSASTAAPQHEHRRIIVEDAILAHNVVYRRSQRAGKGVCVWWRASPARVWRLSVKARGALAIEILRTLRVVALHVAPTISAYRSRNGK